MWYRLKWIELTCTEADLLQIGMAVSAVLSGVTQNVPGEGCCELSHTVMSTYFDVHVTVHRDKFLIIKPTRRTHFSNLFWNETLNVSDSSSVHHHEFSTVHTAMVHVIQICWQLASRIRMEQQFHPDPARKLSANLYDIYHCCVYSGKLMMDRGTVWNM